MTGSDPLSTEYFEMFWSNATRGGRGALFPHFGRYVPRQSEKWGLRSELDRENGGLLSGTDFIDIVKNGNALPMDGRVWLALWPAAGLAGWQWTAWT